ncbi:hypothetical protein [Cellulomonas palmilytica]|uniref:hypothetical protein n=1 Tax=Cellulomonas palmilytica TaxID=2608402 RepID=UPI001F3ED3A5|nr:hypothetical protein [Cellulomonas palmilytica]UJP40055.1 hypothetical protein F1D97_00380 [Cellulomonas palmilytica]
MLSRAAAATALPLVTGLLLVASSTGAWAGGSDDPVPYSVTVDGLTLAPGDTFANHDHVNVTYTHRGRTGSANLHIEGTRSTGGLIGKNAVRWDTVGIPENSCITWVQVSKYNEHYGEGGQKPVCSTTCRPTPNPTYPPQPSPSPTPTPYPTYPPRPTPTPTPTATPTPPVEEPTTPPVEEPTPTPEPSDEAPTPEPTPEETTPAPTPTEPTPPSDEETPTPEPSLSSPVAPGDDDEVVVAGPTPTPSYPSAVLADEPEEPPLAATGSDSLVPGLAAGLGALAAGAGLLAVHARKRYRPAHRR